MATTLYEWHGADSWPSSNPATPDVRNARSCWAFDPTTNESIYLELVVPQSYAGGTLTLRIRCATDAITGDVDVDVSVEDAGALDLDTDSFDTVNSTDNTSVPGTAGTEFEISVTLTNKDSVSAGDLCRLKVTRDAASDTAASDLQMFHFELREA